MGAKSCSSSSCFKGGLSLVLDGAVVAGVESWAVATYGANAINAATTLIIKHFIRKFSGFMAAVLYPTKIILPSPREHWTLVLCAQIKYLQDDGRRKPISWFVAFGQSDYLPRPPPPSPRPPPPPPLRAPPPP